jgi:hypothetical protein
MKRARRSAAPHSTHPPHRAPGAARMVLDLSVIGVPLKRQQRQQ